MVETTFEDVGGLGEQIRGIREFVELPLAFPQLYRQLGISPPRGVIFYGAPGTGKTLLARSVAKICTSGAGFRLAVVSPTLRDPPGWRRD